MMELLPTETGARPLRLLFFVPGGIYPVNAGGSSRITNEIWGLSRLGHEVHVLSLVGSLTEQRAMQSMPGVASSESHVVPPDLSYFWGGALPSSARRPYRSWISDRLVQLAREYSVDVAQLEYTQSAGYVASLQAAGIPVVMVEHDVAFLSTFRRLKVARGPLRAAYALFDGVRLHHWELKQARRADLVLTASAREAQILSARGVTRVSDAVPNGVDVARLEPRGPREEDRDLLFVGNFSLPPNRDGLSYFASAIWPRLAALRPGLGVTVVGPRLPGDLAASIAGLGFRYAGYVEDLSAELWSHKVFIVPIRYGAGTRIKVLEAAAAKCAMVSTKLGAEGIGLQDGRDLLLADEPDAFARAVVCLLDDPGLRAALGASAHDLVSAQFDWPVLVRNLEGLYRTLLKQA